MDSYNDIWELVRSYCREKVSETIYSLWLEPLELKSFEDDQVILSASDFKANIVRSKFKNLLDEAFENYMGFPIDVVIQSEGRSDERAPKAEEKPKSMNHPMVNDELTFDTFVVGSSNTFAHAAALAVANAPGEAYNPLFIYGNSGLGKTHLLYAICDRIARDNPDAKILLEDRIRTRFEWGLLADIQPPDLETRIAIIKRKADFYRLDLPDDVVQFIAEKIKNNVRQLEGTVKKLHAYYNINHQRPTVQSATKVITDLMNDFQPVPVTIDKILNEVARTYGTTVENITSEKRNSNITQARKAAIYIVREITGLSYEEIGKAFGGKHHSTVMYNYEQAEKEMKKDPAVRSTIQSIINNINEAQTNY